MPAKTTHQLEDVNNPYGYSDMDWAAPLDPAYAAARAEVRRLSVGEDGTLSVKVKIPAASGGALEGRSLLCWGNLSPKPPNKDAIPPHRKQWGILASFRKLRKFQDTAASGDPCVVNNTPIWLYELAMPARSPSSSARASERRYHSSASSYVPR